MRTGKTARESEGGQGVLDAAVGNIMMCAAPVFRSPNWRVGDLLGLLGTFLGEVWKVWEVLGGAWVLPCQTKRTLKTERATGREKLVS